MFSKTHNEEVVIGLELSIIEDALNKYLPILRKLRLFAKKSFCSNLPIAIDITDVLAKPSSLTSLIEPIIPATTNAKVKKKDEKFLILFLYLESCLTKALSFV